MHRRTGLSFGFAALASLSVLATLAVAQGPAPAPFMVHQLKPNVYWVEGGGGNSGVIVGDKGVIVVDAKTTPAAGKELLDDIAKITPKPVTTVILTHSDGDHVNGLASFPAGITIIAHENNKKEQEAALAAGGRGAPPADHLPTQTVSKNKENLKIDGVKLEVLHWAPAHTSGDLVVYLPAAEDRVHRRYYRDATSRSADPSGEERLVGRLDHDRQGNRRPSTRISSCPGTEMCRRRPPFKSGRPMRQPSERRSRTWSRRASRWRKSRPPLATHLRLRAAAVVAEGPAFASFTEVVYQELTKKGA